MFEESIELETVEAAPGTVEVFPGFSLLPRVVVVQELVNYPCYLPDRIWKVDIGCQIFNNVSVTKSQNAIERQVLKYLLLNDDLAVTYCHDSVTPDPVETVHCVTRVMCEVTGVTS